MTDAMMVCSFCRKSQHDVKKLVAGPGVFICNECVALAQKFMDESPDPPSGQPPKISWPSEAPTETLLGLLSNQEKTLADVREQVQRSVDILRERKISWEKIGGALGVSRQAAWERFGSAG